MKKLILAFIFLFVHLQIAYGQESKIKGHMSISISKGTMECEFTISNVPQLKDYLILLNGGFNITWFRKEADNADLYYDKEYMASVSEESFGYYFPDNTRKGKYLPPALKIKYVGAFPVYSDTTDMTGTGDWKGNIAFNGKYVRASEQCVWYPVLYDKTKDKKYSNVKYEITVDCKDCEQVYLNGSPVQNGKNKTFTSPYAEQIMLFAGNYKVFQHDSITFLNPDISQQQMNRMVAMTSTYKKIYEKKLLIPYTRNIVYIQATPVSKLNSWLFVTYPAIVSVGFREHGFKGLFSRDTAWFKNYIAHELAHFYFGTYRKFNSELSSMISEGFSEYLSLKCLQTENDSLYRVKVAGKVSKCSKDEVLSVSEIHSKTDFKNTNTYYYDYIPVILLAIEKETGETTMNGWIRAILESKDEVTNYEFLKKTLSVVLNDPEKLQRLESQFFTSETAAKNAEAVLSAK